MTPARPESDPPPRPGSEEKTGFDRQEMVPWLSPKFLVKAGIEVVVSSAFSKLLDKRELAAGLPGYGKDLGQDDDPPGPFTAETYRDEDKPLWIDYVSDVGEGFHPTYTVASLLAQETLELGPGLVTKRGRALVLGGDQVYPSATWEEYRNRFVGPYQAALPYVEPPSVPHMYAIPGNHDWYDGLTSFTRLFTQGSWIGGWRTRQRRSYFVLRLTERWWLWATDIQFDTYLDGPQLEYFRAASSKLAKGDRVILATAKPSWVRAASHDEIELKKEGAWQTLAYVEQDLIGKSKGKLALTVTGDHHFYARYAKQSGEGPAHRITAGGGGAHTMGTATYPEKIHPPSLDDSKQAAAYELCTRSPTPRESGEMRDGIVPAVLRRGLLGVVIGSLYALLALAFTDAVKDHDPDLTDSGGSYSLGELLLDGLSTFSVVLIALFVGGLFFFADIKRKRDLHKRAFAGLTHSLAHIALALAAPAALLMLFEDGGVAKEGMALGWLAAAAAFVIGWVVGLLVFAVYLFLMNRSHAGRHAGEVWGGLASSDYKNFLRMKIDAQERLTIYPIGIRNPVTWHFEAEGGDCDPWYVPDDESPLAQLIEPPIVIDP